MNPFEAARLKAIEARLVLSKLGLLDSTKGYELIAHACKKWDFGIFELPPGNPLLNGADAVIRIHQKRIVVRSDLDDSVKL